MAGIIRVGTELTDDVWAGEATCPKCGKKNTLHLMRVRQVMTLGASFPLNTLHRVIGCTECDAVVRELSKQEYDALVAKQRRQLDSGELPSEVLATFANAPKRLARKTVGLVAAVFWALCLLAVAGALVGDPGFDASMSVIVVVIIAAALYPVVRAARGRAEVARYARAYRRASASRS